MLRGRRNLFSRRFSCRKSRVSIAKGIAFRLLPPGFRVPLTYVSSSSRAECVIREDCPPGWPLVRTSGGRPRVTRPGPDDGQKFRPPLPGGCSQPGEGAGRGRCFRRVHRMIAIVRRPVSSRGRAGVGLRVRSQSGPDVRIVRCARSARRLPSPRRSRGAGRAACPYSIGRPGHSPMTKLQRMGPSLAKFRVIPGECPVAASQLMIICPYPFCDASWRGASAALSARAAAIVAEGREREVPIMSGSAVRCPAQIQVARKTARCKRSA